MTLSQEIPFTQFSSRWRLTVRRGSRREAKLFTASTHNVALFEWDWREYSASSVTLMPSGSLLSQKLQDVRNDQQDVSHFAESFCDFCYQRRSWQRELRKRIYCPRHSVEQLADNALIARKFRALGFSGVRVTGTGAMRRVEGVWPRKDATAPLPRQIVAVARL